MLQKVFSLLLTVMLSSVIAIPASAVEGPVLVFGGTSGTGFGAVQFLRAEGIPVTVFVRPTSNTKPLEPLDVNMVVGNALNADDVNAAFASDSYKAVISSLGGRRGEPRPDYDGNKNITAGAKATGVNRIIQVSSMGAGETREPPNDKANFMGNVLYLKTLAEDDLISSGLDYTIIRPGHLKRGETTGTGILQTEEMPGAIDRQELGRIIVEALDNADTFNKILYAIDPSHSKPSEGEH